jgi:hypothetical protein
MTIIHHHGKSDAGQRVASLAGGSVFDIMRAPRRLMWKQWQTTDAGALRLGAEIGRPRVKFVEIAEMLATAR